MGNMISTIGAFFMAIGTIVLVINVLNNNGIKRESCMIHGDGRTLEWTIPSPPPNIILNNCH